MKVSGLVKGGLVSVGYYDDGFIQNRVTIKATFYTALGKHRAWMRMPQEMIAGKSEDELKEDFHRHLNRYIRNRLFGRAFNMVKRLRKFEC